MEVVKTSIVLAILCASFLCAIDAQSPKTRGRQLKAKVPLSSATGAKCGLSNARTLNKGRIIGGADAIPHSWPWQVSSQCLSASCGGSLISDKWVITAAHCLDPRAGIDSRRGCQVLLGKHNMQLTESTQLIAKVADYYVHEKFNVTNFKNGYDLALIKLAEPVKFTDAIQPICLPSGLPELPYNKSCIATGWGYTGRAISPGTLMQLPMSAIDASTCTKKYNSTDRIVCVTSWDLKKDICSGDSGGPLVCQEDDGKWYLRGALSWGPKNCSLRAAFTKVTAFEKWITTIISR